MMIFGLVLDFVFVVFGVVGFCVFLDFLIIILSIGRSDGLFQISWCLYLVGHFLLRIGIAYFSYIFLSIYPVNKLISLE